MTNAQEIYTFLRGKGFTESGALGIMGNLQAESGLFPCRLQGDYQDGFAVSKAYADRVDNGILPVDKAASDGLGWGLAQWTYPSRKKALLLFCLGNSVSIGNLQAQLDFLVTELRRDFVGLNQYLCSTGDLYEATSHVCKEYERPAVNNIQARYEFALGLKKVVADPAEPPEAETFWPPRMLCQGMNGPDVEALQGLLYAHGITYGSTKGVFGVSTDKAVRRFQSERGLVDDGIAGPLTWTELLKL